MATTTVNALTALTSAAVGDKVPIWDISEGQYKAITTANLLASLPTQQVITFTPASASQTLIQITPLNALAEDFIVRTEVATFNSVVDTTHQIGFNVHPVDAAKPSIYLQWEQDYQYQAAYGRSEFIITCKQPTSAGGAYLRPYQVNLEHDLDDIQVYYDADGHNFSIRGSTTTFGIQDGGINIGGSTTIRYDANDVNMLNLPISGGGWFAALKANASNEMQLTQAGYPVRVMDDLKIGDGYIDLHNGNLNTLTTKIAFGAADESRWQHYIKTAHDNGDYITNKFIIAVCDSGAATSKDVLTVTGAQLVGVNDTTPDAVLDLVAPSATAAVPVLLLEQLDVSEPFIKLVGASTTDNSQSLVDAANLSTPGAIVGWVKIYVEDVQGTGPITDGVYWVPFYATPTA